MHSDREPGDEFARWILAAKQGSNDALGQVLEACRSYLLLVARRNLGNGMRHRIGASSVVQATCLDASVCLPEQFEGSNEAELKAWLRRILLNNLANEVRKLKTDKRDIDRVIPLDGLGDGPADPALSPGAQAAAREEAKALEHAIAQLPDDYRQVILLRNREHLTWSEVGDRLERSPEAARQVWSRALVKLHELLEPPDGT